jgi:hypothetical protein
MRLTTRVDRLEKTPTMPADVRALFRKLETGEVAIKELTDEQLDRLIGKGWDEAGRARLKALSVAELERIAEGETDNAA